MRKRKEGGSRGYPQINCYNYTAGQHELQRHGKRIRFDGDLGLPVDPNWCQPNGVEIWTLAISPQMVIKNQSEPNCFLKILNTISI